MMCWPSAHCWNAKPEAFRCQHKVSITGFDDLPLSANLTPSLTTMHIPFKSMGEKAAQYLIDVLAGGQPTANTEVDVTLVVRQSSTLPP